MVCPWSSSDAPTRLPRGRACTHTQRHEYKHTHPPRVALTGRPASRPACGPWGCAAGPRCRSAGPSSAPPGASPRSPAGRAVLRPPTQQRWSGRALWPHLGPPLPRRLTPSPGAGFWVCPLERTGPRAGHLTLSCRVLHGTQAPPGAALGRDEMELVQDLAWSRCNLSLPSGEAQILYLRSYGPDREGTHVPDVQQSPVDGHPPLRMHISTDL